MSKKTIKTANISVKALIPCALFLLIPLIAQAQRDKGSKDGGARPRFDPGAIIEKMSKGKGYIELNSLPSMFRRGLDDYAKKNGITNGRLTKDQMMKYLQQRGNRRGGSGGSSASNNRSQSGSNRNSRSDSGRNSQPVSKEDFNKRLKRSTDDYFNPRDKNKDRVLDQSEMSSRLKSAFKKYDRNGDGKINYDEATNYIRGYVERRYGMKSGSSQKFKPRSAINTTVDQSILDKRPIVYRAGIVPDSLPSWFKENDNDGDSQVGLYEWRTAGNKLKDFDQYDRNRDGFLTVEEMLYFEKFAAKSSEKGDSPGAGGTNEGKSISPPSEASPRSEGQTTSSDRRSRMRDFFNRMRKRN